MTQLAMLFAAPAEPELTCRHCHCPMREQDIDLRECHAMDGGACQAEPHGSHAFPLRRGYCGVCDVEIDSAAARAPCIPEPSVRLTVEDYPPIPSRLPCLPFWQPYDSLILAGVKTEETRGRRCSFAPSWLGIYSTKRVALLSIGVPDRGRLTREHVHPEHAQHVLGVVYVTGSRPMVPEDFARALFYEAGRFAWHLEMPLRLRRALPLAEVGLRAPPQGLVYIDGTILTRTGLLPLPTTESRP